MSQHTPAEHYDWPKLVGELNRLLRLKTTPIGMKLFERAEAMQAIPKLRRPGAVHTTDQIVAQAARLGFTVGITREDLVGAQCGAVIGLAPQDEEWRSGRHMAGVWFATVADASAHQHAMDVVPHGKYQAMAVSPLAPHRETKASRLACRLRSPACSGCGARALRSGAMVTSRSPFILRISRNCMMSSA